MISNKAFTPLENTHACKNIIYKIIVKNRINLSLQYPSKKCFLAAFTPPFLSVKLFSRIERAGFTLIEILLVLVLLGIFVGLVIPRVGILFFDYEFHSTINQIEKLIRFASYNSVLNGNIYRLTIDRREKSFVLFQKGTDDDKQEFENVPGRAGSSLILPQNMDISDLSMDTVYFFPDGSSTIATVTLTYRNEKTVSFVMKGYIHGFKVVYAK